ncbi:PREDICTED: collagen type IV alpha-3-binding protein-like [Priapulus caudatus]|uniref:Collagen type IV alpha-3-binding protein-like n=1 Tax=Priapulus caudatus TaxID=37621 RepID=A0ABM1DZ42_PRICU|nr:PREDICTED: collagen type IV alpha-3-binding protein-like [Priapulus caudatus]
MSDENIANLTDEEEDEFEEGRRLCELHGTLSKWTNYIHGWQERYIVLKDGTLSYYKSEHETDFGCRGAISISKAVIQPHEFDECRFDIQVNDNVWYLRCGDGDDRQRWVEALENYKADSGFGSENNLHRHGSLISITSANSLSTTSTSSFKQRGRGLKEKLAEMETFRDILCQQVDTLQRYFDTCTDAMSDQNDQRISPDRDGEIDDIDEEYGMPVNTDHLLPRFRKDSPCSQETLAVHAAHSIDFKGEAITFKATTAGIIATLSHCIELLTQREDSWKKRLEKELDRRKKVEELYRRACEKLKAEKQTKPIVRGGPDFEEGPYSALAEDEFFDAVDAALDKLDKEDEQLQRQWSRENHQVVVKSTSLPYPAEHRLSVEIEERVAEHIRLMRADFGNHKGDWELFAEEGDMKLYRMELEENGLVLDPLRAMHVVKGVTAHELCHYFFDMGVRKDWDTSLENSKVIETLAADTLVEYQHHKRLWPTTARDACFWSHIRQIHDDSDSESQPIWVVANYSTEHPEAPPTKCIRMLLNVALICQTVMDPPGEHEQITRDHITTKLTYTSQVNPGGWAPVSVLRTIYKREYPRFVKRFTQYVKDQTKDKPIMF